MPSRLPVIELKKKPLASLVPRLFSKLIQGRGLDFMWSRAVFCTCSINSETEQFDPGCPRCGGDGWQYVHPDEPTTPGLTVAGFTGAKVQAVISSMMLDPSVTQPFGGWTFSDALMTVQNEMKVGFRDRFIALAHRMAWQEILIRGADEVPVGKQRPASIKATAMRYEPIEVNWVAAPDPSDPAAQIVYYEGVDYDLTAAVEADEDHAITPVTAKFVWRPDMGPAAGVAYTIHYACHPVWIVEDSTYTAQTIYGPREKLKGQEGVQDLPTTFKVKMDYITRQRP